MKYFFDTEFIEGFRKRIFKPETHFIDLVSIGMVAEDGRKLYLFSNEFNPEEADHWVADNVLAPLYDEIIKLDWGRYKYQPGYTTYPSGYSPKKLKYALRRWGHNRKEIATEIKKFINGGVLSDLRSGLYPDKNEVELHNPNSNGNAQPEFYSYYANYDWVVFCSQFGRMPDLPDGFPMYCRDLKQMLDEKAESLNWYEGRDCWGNMRILGEGALQPDDRLATLEEKLRKIESLPAYPKQENEHSAIDDAHWNKELYDFIKTTWTN